MYSILLVSAILLGQAGREQPPSLPPLTEDQLVRLRKLVKDVQTRDAELKASLQEKQQVLAAEYGKFELNAAAAEKLQGEILALQKLLLANYHRLQVELRSIVGQERFAVLKRRIDFSLNPPKDSKQSTEDGAARGK